MPPEHAVAAYLRQARQRLIARSALIAADATLKPALVVALLMLIAGASGRDALRNVVIGSALLFAFVLFTLRRHWRDAAASIEAAMPALKNQLVTARELLAGTSDAKPYMRALVMGAASSQLARVPPAALFPVRPLAIKVGGLAVLTALVVGLTFTRTGAAPLRELVGSLGVGSPAAGLEVDITPPPYTGVGASKVTNPDRVEAIEGSAIAVRRGHETLATLAASTQTFISIEDGRTLIPLSVIPDRAPDVKVEAPAKDLFFPAPGRDVQIRVTARDDFGVTSLTLAYTKVSGSGESFEFVEGTLPLALNRASARELSGTAILSPSRLGLAEGDLIVYRAIAHDAKPGRGPIESDAFVVELVAKAGAMAEGFAIDDQRERYALSQQMIVIKTEQLRARSGRMAPEAVAEEAALIAAEQRQVRAEFVFMMGGEIEDEEVEAEHAHELAEGQEQNRGRRDLLSAIRNMSDSAALLMRPDVPQALGAAKRALEALQRAFTRSRYILRVLSQRERIDDARRLSGDRSAAAAWRREAERRPLSPAERALLDTLTALARLARRERYTQADASQLSALAQSLVRDGGHDARIAKPAALVASAARAASRGDARDAATLIDDAALAAEAVLAAALAPRSTVAPDAATHRLRSALADRLRGSRR